MPQVPMKTADRPLCLLAVGGHLKALKNPSLLLTSSRTICRWNISSRGYVTMVSRAPSRRQPPAPVAFRQRDPLTNCLVISYMQFANIVGYIYIFLDALEIVFRISKSCPSMSANQSHLDQQWLGCIPRHYIHQSPCPAPQAHSRGGR